MNWDGSNGTRLTDNPTGDAGPDWQPVDCADLSVAKAVKPRVVVSHSTAELDASDNQDRARSRVTQE
jgi:hypothetical protein